VIERYVREEMKRIWSDERRLALWLDVELAVTGERERRGMVPAGVTERLRKNSRIDARRMSEIEDRVRHDVIAFLSMVAESGGEEARHLHVGMTSSDLVDTALALQIAEGGRVLLEDLGRLRRAAHALAVRHKSTPMAGRTHGMHAEPITFGLKCLGWSEEIGRSRDRLATALEDVAVGKLSGAVGTLAHLDAAIEGEALKRLGLRAEPVATQVVPRDRHAGLLSAMAIAAGTVERIALEIRHLQRTEVGEAEEPFESGQKGSSAMPHKRNPVRCERLCGLARLLRGHALAAFENQALWHERDISHSSVERVILPDAFQVLDFIAAELSDILERLVVHPKRMLQNLEAGGGLVHSQQVLLALVDAGLPRDAAYAIVQRHAMAALDGGPPFRDGLAGDADVQQKLGDRLEKCFRLEGSLKSVDELFARAGVPE
jgi:adenylosuccinate lyase